ncbi:MAG: hypothetical protein EXR72_04090 [Myxococcales bacterium]|nr:hypothetical protein [Myxococcales bacterium]
MPAVRRSCALALLLLSAGCTHKLEGPAPTASAIAPAAACNAQVSTVMMLSGDGFSPLHDVLLGMDQLELPLLAFTRQKDIEGAAITGEPAVLVPNDPAHADLADEKWIDPKSMQLTLCPPGTCSQATPPATDYALAPGLYALTVTNRNQKSATLDGAVAVVPLPHLESVTPDLLCHDAENLVTLKGDFFLRVDGQPSTVTIGGKPFAPKEMSECRPLASPRQGAPLKLEACKVATVVIPAQTFPSGIVEVTVSGPTPVGCRSVERHTLTFVPEPTVIKVAPDLICLDDHEQVVTVSGTGFLSVDGKLPQVILLDNGPQHVLVPLALDGCAPVAGPREVVQSCTTLTFRLDKGALPVGNYNVVVKNPVPADCPSRQKVDLTVVSRPSLKAVVPDVVCTAQGDTSLLLTGADLLTIDGVLPTVAFGGVVLPTSDPGGCVPLPGPTEMAQRCTTLKVVLPKGMVAAGLQPATVKNPAPAGCVSTPPVNLLVVPPPTLTAVVADLVCNTQGDTTFTLAGTNFIGLDQQVPTVQVLQNGMMVASGKGVLAGCAALTGALEMVQSCTSLKVTFAKGTLPAGLLQAAVQNPLTVGCASGPINMLAIPPPKVDAVKPSLVCTLQSDVTLIVSGSSFLTVGNGVPSVTFTDGNGKALVIQNGIAASNCQPLVGVVEMAQLCATLTVPVPKGSFADGAVYTATVLNPAPAACTSMDKVTVTGTGPPTIADVNPKKICAGGDTLTLAGSGFSPGNTVTLGGVAATKVESPDPGTLKATFEAGLKPGGPYDLTVSNGCSSTLAKAVTVTPGPVVFFVDPPVVWNGIGTTVTVYAANIVPPMKTVSLVLGNNTVPLNFVVSQKNVNRATAVVPKGIPEGAYDVVVRDQTTCPAILGKGLKVVSKIAFAPTVAPPFGYNKASTAVTISSPGAGAFLATPRAYLNPVGGGNNPATALASVAYLGPSTLTGVVPQLSPELTPGKYDLIVVNPDGTVGVAQAAFTVTGSATPVVLNVLPGAVQTSQPVTFNVSGKNFANGAVVTLRCVDQVGTPVNSPALMAGALGNCNPGPQCIPITTTFAGSGACVVRVTNPDSAFFDFSSLVVSNPSLKLGNFQDGALLVTGRRALAVASVQATPTARFLYALGGDKGSEASALSTVEAAPVDVFGKLSPWVTLPYKLAKPHTFTGAAAVGRALYVVGGSDGAGAKTTVERAFVLDPLNVPVIADVDIVPGGGKGLGGGGWYYRIAPVMAQNDPFNPGGEGLASDEFVIQLPVLVELAQVTLTWTPVAGAATYRVYRSALPNQASGSEVLIAENIPANALAFTDAGATPILLGNATVPPLPPGSTGVWVAVASLSTARMGAAVTSAADLAQSNVTYIYAISGNSGSSANPSLVASYEYLKVTEQNDGTHALSTWTQPGGGIGTARWQTGGFSLPVGNQSWVWAGSGLAGGGANPNIDGAQVMANGALSNFTVLGKQMGNRAGYAAVAVNGFLFALGGGGAMPDASAIQGQLDIPPQVKNWPNSTSLATARYLTAGVVVSGFLFIVGGQVPGEAASVKTESTIW